MQVNKTEGADLIMQSDRVSACLTCVVVPDPYFGEISQAEDVREAERVHLLALKLVGLGGLFQRQRPRVSVLSEYDDPHVGISACP